jgi:ubiquinone/menaquinone biosynthesis C-methylase UbiE
VPAHAVAVPPRPPRDHPRVHRQQEALASQAVPRAAHDSPPWAEEIKHEARAQWGHNPAGDLAAGDAPLGTPESFARVEAHRYREQPWMRETFKFERYSGRDVLEIGVGLGTDHVQFARTGARLSGIDLTPRCVELTRRRIELEGLTSDLRVMDAEQLEYDRDSFDAVYSFGVLHHTAYPARAFAEVRRVLRPGGVFLGGLYNKRSAVYALIVAQRIVYPRLRAEPIEDRLSRVEHSTSNAKPLVRLLTAGELRGLLNAAGFTEVSIGRRHLGLGRNSITDALESLGGRVAGWYLIHHAR